MAELKTQPTKNSVQSFIKKVADEQRRKDCEVVLDLMADVTKAKPEMWGSSIVGFGRYKQKYASGREAEWMLTGFSPRKGDLTLYIMGRVRPVSRIDEETRQVQNGKSLFVYQETL